MRVAIIPTSTWTGERAYGDYLIPGLRNKGIEVDLIDTRYFQTPHRKIWVGSLLLKKTLMHKGLVIVHNLDNLGPYLIKRSLEHVRPISTVHDIAPLILPYMSDWVIKADFGLILPRLLNNSSLIIVPSKSTKGDIISKFSIGENKIAIIEQGVDTSFFYPRHFNQQVLRKYHIPNQYLLYAGTDSARKNLVNLILGYSKICDEISHDLVLVGMINRDYVERVVTRVVHAAEAQQHISQRIHLVGYVERADLPYIYSSASALVLPSLYEGFGMPPLEAMACGTIAVVSNNSSLREIVDGSAILINDPLDPEEISARILQALEKDDESDLKQRGLSQAQKYTWENTVQKTIAAYDKVAQM